MSAAGDAVADLLARIRALEAECARKDAALRKIKKEVSEYAEASKNVGLGAYGACATVRMIARAALKPAALGPWVPTHMLAGKILVRQRDVSAHDGGRAIGLFEARDGTLYSRYPDDQKVRALTPDEARAATEGRS